MTVKQRLHQHLTELERGEVFSHKRMKDMVELIDKLAAPPLPVVRIEDCELTCPQQYSIRTTGEVWLHDQIYREDQEAFFDSYEDENPYHIDDITHVVLADDIDKALNASIKIQEES